MVKSTKATVKNGPRAAVATGKHCEICNAKLMSDGVYVAIIMRYVGLKCGKAFVYFCKPHQPTVSAATGSPKR